MGLLDWFFSRKKCSGQESNEEKHEAERRINRSEQKLKVLEAEANLYRRQDASPREQN